MASSPEYLGGTPGARWLPSSDEVKALIEEIATRHGMSFADGQRPFQPLIDAGEFNPESIRSVMYLSIRAAIIETVKRYREAPPPAPSRVARDFVEPATKAAGRLAASLENEHARAVVASMFSNYQDAEQFIANLKKLADAEQVSDDDKSRLKVQKLADEFGITLLDPRDHILKTFGPSALEDYDRIEERVDQLDKKHRTDPIRFRLACEVVRAVINGFGQWESIALRKGIKRQALQEIVTLIIEVVGTFEGAPQPSEDYFAKTLTNEAIELLIAEYDAEEASTRFGI